jgi:hypothetical protein
MTERGGLFVLPKVSVLLRQLKLAHILNGKARLNPCSTHNKKLRDANFNWYHHNLF